MDAMDMLVTRGGPKLRQLPNGEFLTPSDHARHSGSEESKGGESKGGESKGADGAGAGTHRESAASLHLPSAEDLIGSLFGDASRPSAAGVHADLHEHPTFQKFVHEIRSLYAMLLAVTKCPETADFEDQRAEASLALIHYLRRSHRHDLYTRYGLWLCGCVAVWLCGCVAVWLWLCPCGCTCACTSAFVPVVVALVATK